MTNTETLKQALEALGAYMEATDSEADAKAHSLMAAAFFKLKEAVAEAEKQEPVAWMYRDAWGTLKLSQVMPPPIGAFPVYTTPPAQPCPYIRSTAEGTHHCALSQRQPLTEEEIMQTWEGVIKYAPGEVRLKDFARAIEAAHGIGENT